MKKLCTVTSFCLLLMVTGQTFKYGLTGNVHKGSIVGVHKASKGAYGGGLGLFGQWSLVQNDFFDAAWLYIMPQIEYSTQGEIAKFKEEKYGVQRFNHDYIVAALYLKYFFHQSGYRRDLFVFAGPRIEFLVREDRHVDPEYDLTNYRFNLDDEVNQFGYGVSFGAGLKVSPQVEAFLRYDRGFSKVYPNNDRHHTYNRLLAVGVNYYLKDN